MKKENIFDLFEQQHKEDQKEEPERIRGEVTPEDIEPANEVTPEPKQEPEQPTPEPTPEPVQEPQEGGNENGA
jgi:hypothetical protein